MAGRIIAQCATDKPLTGYNRCSKGEALTDALLFHDPNVSYTIDREDFISELPSLVYSLGANRIYPVKNIDNSDITGGDTNTSDSGSGFTVPTNKSQVIATYTLRNDDCLFKQLKKMEHIDWRVFRVDQDGYIYGTVSNDRFRGFLCQVSVRRIQATGTDQSFLYLEVYYSAKYEKELANLNGFYVGEENVPDGLVPVIVESDATAGTNVVVGECSGVDYTSIYGTEWTAEMFVTSAGATPQSVTYNAANNTLTFSPDGEYQVADASVLAPLGVTGITGVTN